MYASLGKRRLFHEYFIEFCVILLSNMKYTRTDLQDNLNETILVSSPTIMQQVNVYKRHLNIFDILKVVVKYFKTSLTTYIHSLLLHVSATHGPSLGNFCYWGDHCTVRFVFCALRHINKNNDVPKCTEDKVYNAVVSPITINVVLERSNYDITGWDLAPDFEEHPRYFCSLFFCYVTNLKFLIC
jgi:hypothetical protein